MLIITSETEMRMYAVKGSGCTHLCVGNTKFTWFYKLMFLSSCLLLCLLWSE